MIGKGSLLAGGWLALSLFIAEGSAATHWPELASRNGQRPVTGEQPWIAPNGRSLCFELVGPLSCAKRGASRWQVDPAIAVQFQYPSVSRDGTTAFGNNIEIPMSVDTIGISGGVLRLATRRRVVMPAIPGVVTGYRAIAISDAARYVLAQRVDDSGRRVAEACIRVDLRSGAWITVPHGSVNRTCEAMSGDGRFVVVAERVDTSAPPRRLIRRELATGEEDVVDVDADGDSRGTNVAIALSQNGRYVGFSSLSSKLVPGDTNGAEDVFVRDMALRRTRRVNLGPGGRQTSGGLWPGGGQWMSADGRIVAFATHDPGLGGSPTVAQLVVRDLKTGRVRVVSRNRLGRYANEGVNGQFALNISGRYVAFSTMSSNLDLTVTDNNVENDVYFLDLGNFAPHAMSRVIGVRRTGRLLSFSGARSSDRDGRIKQWRWAFGDGRFARGRVVRHRYSAPGTYNFTLTVIDNEGGRHSVRRKVAIR